MDRFITAMWCEIARRKQVCNSVGADDAYEYNQIRAERAARANTWSRCRGCCCARRVQGSLRIKPISPRCSTKSDARAAPCGCNMLLASQDIDSRAEKLLENDGYPLVLRQNTSAQRVGDRRPACGQPAPRGRCGVHAHRIGRRTHRFRAVVAVARLPPPGRGQRRRH